jgi:hypothetical protein
VTQKQHVQLKPERKTKLWLAEQCSYKGEDRNKNEMNLLQSEYDVEK